MTLSLVPHAQLSAESLLLTCLPGAEATPYDCSTRVRSALHERLVHPLDVCSPARLRAHSQNCSSSGSHAQREGIFRIPSLREAERHRGQEAVPSADRALGFDFQSI